MKFVGLFPPYPCPKSKLIRVVWQQFYQAALDILWYFPAHYVRQGREKEGLQWKEKSSCSNSCVEASIPSRMRFGGKAAVFLAAGAISEAEGQFPLPSLVRLLPSS